MQNGVGYLDYCPEDLHIRLGGWAWLKRSDLDQASDVGVMRELQYLLRALDYGCSRNVVLTNIVHLWLAVKERQLVTDFTEDQAEMLDRLLRIRNNPVRASTRPLSSRIVVAMELTDAPICGR